MSPRIWRYTNPYYSYFLLSLDTILSKLISDQLATGQTLCRKKFLLTTPVHVHEICWINLLPPNVLLGSWIQSLRFEMEPSLGGLWRLCLMLPITLRRRRRKKPGKRRPREVFHFNRWPTTIEALKGSHLHAVKEMCGNRLKGPQLTLEMSNWNGWKPCCYRHRGVL